MSVRSMLVGEHEIVVTDTDQAAQRTFLLVHGIGMGISYFAQLSEELVRYGRVVAIDLPGFGDAPESLPVLSMAQTGGLLIDFVELAELEQVILVGHSMGTQVVAEAAAQRPDLFSELVLVAPTVNRQERTIARQAWRMVQDLSGESPRVLFIGAQNYVKTGPRWFIKKLRHMMDHSLEDILPSISAHTLVIRGNRDRVCPRGWVEEVAALIPDATMVEVPGRGHETMVKDGVGVAERIMEHLGVAA